MNRAYALGGVAYLIWGFAALYWIQVVQVSPVDLVAHRTLWSLPILALCLLVGRRLRSALRVFTQPRLLLILGLSTVMQAANWGVFLWALAHQQATEASLGYFILPLINVLIGLTVFRERIDTAQKVAIALAVLGVVIMVLARGGLPWVALGVSVSFALYGAIRKAAPIGTLEGMFVEISLLFPLALGWMVYTGWAGLGLYGVRVDGFLLGAGLMTVVPLMCFVSASRDLPLTALGMLFYIGPSCQLLVAVAVFGEPLKPLDLVSFTLVWMGLGVIAADSLRRSRTVKA